MGKRLFCLYSMNKRKNNQKIRKNAREGRYRTSGALILKSTTHVMLWASKSEQFRSLIEFVFLKRII